MLRIETILHPTDFSAPSDHAFHLACSLARDHGAQIVVLHVAELPLIATGGSMTPPLPGGDRETIEHELRAVRAPDEKIAVRHLLAEGDAATEILRVARETRCDLLVMGSHGRTGLKRLLMGNVAEQVTRRAPCAVLVVKAPFPGVNELGDVHSALHSQSGRVAPAIGAASP